MYNIFNVRPVGFNIGNEAIHLGLKLFLEEALDDYVNLITVPAVSHYESHAKAGLTSRTIHDMNQYGDGVIVGGGNLFENGEIAVSTNALPSLEPPLMMYSISRGRIYNRRMELVDRTDVITDGVLRSLAARADHFYVRDSATLAYLREIGCDNVKLGGCPTIFLKQVESRLPPPPASIENEILLSVRNPTLMNIPLGLQAKARNDLLTIIRLAQEKWERPIRLLCHDHRDISYAASFGNLEYIYTGDIYQYLSLLKHAWLNIAYRLHATLPTLSFGRPSVSIVYDERAMSLLKTLELDEFTVGVDENDDLPQRVIQQCENVLARKTYADLSERWKKFEDISRTAFQGFAGNVKRYRETCKY